MFSHNLGALFFFLSENFIKSPVLIVIVIIIIIIGFLIFWIVSKEKDDFVLTDEFKEALNILENSRSSIFITGKAGTGKSTLLRYFISRTKKKFAILAPTGVAALNVKGQTIHSFFKFPPKLMLEADIKINYSKASLYQNLDMIIIDEVSMVSANLMNAIDLALRRNRQVDRPFGNVQMVFMGDMFQLPPVVKSDLVKFYINEYGGIYFFNAQVFREHYDYKFLELSKVFRQSDPAFIELLNNIRVNNAKHDDLVLLNSRYEDNIKYDPTNAIFLTTTNAIVKRINRDNLNQLNGNEKVYQAKMNGTLKTQFDKIRNNLTSGNIDEDKFEELLDKKFPADVFLKLKKGAQVIMIKNDSAKRWVNGSLAQIVKFDDNAITVKIGKNNFQVGREKWEEIEYSYDNSSNKIKANSKGVFLQFPIKLAWALTIHKSQGKTFDKVIIDIGGGAFVHGQTYVALSRCKSLEGIMLKKDIQPTDIIVDQKIIDFYKLQGKN